MRLRHHLAHILGCAAGIDQIVDDQPAGAVAPHLADVAFEELQLSGLMDASRPFGAIFLAVARHADGVDQADVELAGDDCRGHQPAPRDGDDALEGTERHQAPGQRLRGAMQFFPGDRKSLLRTDHEDSPRIEATELENGSVAIISGTAAVRQRPFGPRIEPLRPSGLGDRMRRYPIRGKDRISEALHVEHSMIKSSFFHRAAPALSFTH